MRPKVLFLCTANAARSQMAEALLRKMAGDQFEVFSAGTEPTEVDSRTLIELQACGIATDQLHSKSIASLADQHFDYVITLCSRAQRECRDWPGRGVVMAWDFPDPKSRPEANAYARTLQDISERIRLFVLLHSRQTDSESQLPSALTLFKSLGEETRLLSLLLIDQEGELCVCELMAALEESQPKVSRHLAQLRKSGLLLDRRQGQWVFYRLNPLLPDWMREVLQTTQVHNTELLDPALARLRAMPSRPGVDARVCGIPVTH